jgi:hypothetical protein
MPEPVFMKPGMYIMATEPISTAHFINPSHQSFVYFRLSLLGKGSVKTIPRQRIHATTEELLNARVCVSPNRCKVTARLRRSRGNEELLEASFYMRSVSCQR